MDVIPTDRTEPTEPARRSYQAYLQSPEWRRRRNAKLIQAGWRCERCPARKELQVHHKTYDRLGFELDSDLEVLCRDCHEGHHFEESHRNHLGLYINIAREVIEKKRGAFRSELDLLEDVKVAIAKAKFGVDYQTEKIATAIRIAIGDRPGIIATEPVKIALEQGTEPPTLGKAEALSIVRQLWLTVPIRSMPKAQRIDPKQADRVLAMRLVAQEIADSIARCEALEAVDEAMSPSAPVPTGDGDVAVCEADGDRSGDQVGGADGAGGVAVASELRAAGEHSLEGLHGREAQEG